MQQAKSKRDKSSDKPAPLIGQLYDHMQMNTGHMFTPEELSKELKIPASSIRRSLTRSAKRPDMYPGLGAYDDGTYAFTAVEDEKKPVIKGNTQTETFDPPQPISSSSSSSSSSVGWQPGAIVTVCGQLPTGEVIVAHQGELHMMEITWIGSIPERAEV